MCLLVYFLQKQEDYWICLIISGLPKPLLVSLQYTTVTIIFKQNEEKNIENKNSNLRKINKLIKTEVLIDWKSLALIFYAFTFKIFPWFTG